MNTSDARSSARPPRTALAIALILAGAALFAYALYPVLCIDSVNQMPEVRPITEPELAARKRDVIGTYATGSDPGDRVIVIGANANARFYEIGPRGPIGEAAETCLVCRHDGRLCLATKASGVIDVEDDGTLVYFKDRYQRPK